MSVITQINAVDGGADSALNTTSRAIAWTNNLATGDLMLAIWGVNNNSAHNQTVQDNASTPNTWTQVVDGNASGFRGLGVSWAIANASSNGTKPTVTLNKNGSSAQNNLIILSYRGQHASTFDGSSVSVSSASGTNAAITCNSRSFTDDLCIAAICTRNVANTTATLSGTFTALLSNDNATTQVQLKVATKATAASGTDTATWTLNVATGYELGMVVIKGATTAATITSTDTATPRYLGALTVTGVNFGVTQGVGDETIGGTSQTESSWNDTTVVVNSVARGTNKYGTAVNVVVTPNAGGASNSFALTSLLPQTGWNYVDITTPDTTAANRLTATGGGDLASGDQAAWGNVIGTGSVTVNADGTFVADPGVTSFDYEVWSVSGGGYGTTATEDLTAAAGAASTAVVWF